MLEGTCECGHGEDDHGRQMECLEDDCPCFHFEDDGSAEEE